MRDLTWRGEALVRVWELARRRAYLTTDDVWFKGPFLDMKGVDPRMMGPTMQAAQRAGWIERTNVVQRSKQKTNHRRPVMVWKSNIYIPL